MISRAVLRAALWLALGGWVGAWAFFAFVVSRLAFQLLPGDVAGDMAGALLSILHIAGCVAALVAAGSAIGLGRRGWLVGLPILLGVLCLASELFLTPEVAAVRPSVLGAANTADTQQRFRLLHGLSLGLFMAIHVASYALIWGHARRDALELRAAETGAMEP